MIEVADQRTASQRLADRLTRLGLGGDCPEFTAEEIELIVSVFEARDDQLSRSIAYKAQDFKDRLAVQAILVASQRSTWYSQASEHQGSCTKIVRRTRERHAYRPSDMHSNVSTRRHRERCGYLH